MRTHRHAARLRVVTYNLLVGGREREDLIHGVLRRADADVVALQEVAELPLLHELAATLRMRALVGEPSEPGSVMRTAILSRLPIRSWRNEIHRGRMLRGHLHCEVETGRAAMPVISVHSLHLAARFGERANGEARRTRELAAITTDIARMRPLPRILAGDFNSLSPGDSLAATRFFRRYNEMRRAGLIVNGPNGFLVHREREGSDDAEVDAAWRKVGVDPRLEVGVPSLPRTVARLTAGVPVNDSVDRFLGRLLQRVTMERLAALGYVDVFRSLHPRARGYTCATWLPAARVDYVLATPELAACAVASEVVGSRAHPDSDAHVASDHFPLIAEFALD